MTTNEILKRVKCASKHLSTLSAKERTDILYAMADSLIASADKIILANNADMESARGRLSESMLDRLRLDITRLQAMADGIRSVARLADPSGVDVTRTVRDDGLCIVKRTVPFGVIAIIYESRPNVTSDAAALCIKSGNACVLRSGRDAYLSSRAITDAMKAGIESTGISSDFLAIVDDPSRRSAEELMCASGLVDLLIPRGGAGLIRSVVENATVPCIETGTGICHIYVDKDADIDKAIRIINNAKTSRPSVCNALEVLLVNREIAPILLPLIKKSLVDDRRSAGLTPVELRLDDEAMKYIEGNPATKTDYDTEFLDYILAVKTVENVSEAIEHIENHSTHHSDCIVTENNLSSDLFVSLVDSAAVYVNASTRFTDGGEFGFGCEMGISTQKLHARGPMGLSELCTYKYIVKGDGNVR